MKDKMAVVLITLFVCSCSALPEYYQTSVETEKKAVYHVSKIVYETEVHLSSNRDDVVAWISPEVARSLADTARFTRSFPISSIIHKIATNYDLQILNNKAFMSNARPSVEEDDEEIVRVWVDDSHKDIKNKIEIRVEYVFEPRSESLSGIHVKISFFDGEGDSKGIIEFQKKDMTFNEILRPEYYFENCIGYVQKAMETQSAQRLKHTFRAGVASQASPSSVGVGTTVGVFAREVIGDDPLFFSLEYYLAGKKPESQLTVYLPLFYQNDSTALYLGPCIGGVAESRSDSARTSLAYGLSALLDINMGRVMVANPIEFNLGLKFGLLMVESDLDYRLGLQLNLLVL